MKPTILLLLLAFCGIGAQAQTNYNPRDFKSKPVWIQMMRDTSANFNETVEAFRTFFESRDLPKEPNDEKGGDAFEKMVGLDDGDNGTKSERERERELKNKSADKTNYAFEVRAFKGWYFNNKNWLRADGSIIGPRERQAIVDHQRNELMEIEKANQKN